MELSIPERAAMPAVSAPEAAASGVLPPPIPMGMVAPKKPASRKLSPILRAYVAPTTGFTNELPSGAVPGGPFWTRPRRTSGARFGVSL